LARKTTKTLNTLRRKKSSAFVGKGEERQRTRRETRESSTRARFDGEGDFFQRELRSSRRRNETGDYKKKTKRAREQNRDSNRKEKAHS